MTELEERLSAQGGDVQRQRLVQRLRTVTFRVEQNIARGTPPNEFRDLLAIQDALLAACEVLTEWHA